MTVTLMRHLHGFPGPKVRVRCFLHVINLVAALIICQLERKLSDAGANILGEDEDNVEDDEVDEDEGDSLNDIVELEELEELLTDKDEEDEAIEPVRTAMNKVSAQSSSDESA
jgi:hypothetical protein